MSHYTVMVLSAGEPDLDALLAPFDENMDVEPYERDGEESTYNPNSKWDWWVIGENSRWSDYLLHVDGSCSDQLTRKEWDIATMRGEAELKFRESAKFPRELFAKHGHLPTLVFFDNVGDMDSLEEMERARTAYWGQPEVRAYVELSEEGKFASATFLDRVMVDDAEFERQCKIEAASGPICYATLDLAGRWNAPGRMGWFAMSDDEEPDRIGYYEAMNAMVEALPDDTVITVVDCHI